ncbi:MAG: hypothetical protein KDK91_33565 [Gammaproteobacteria bacterium]|nr:hypothetical protein [Gammaproteobacteria bacterium]
MSLATDERSIAAGRRSTRRPAWLVCQLCSHRITALSAAISFDGAHEHRFTNPAGLTFLIILQRRAPGCVEEGNGSEYWSWFPGYTWRVTACGGCGLHLGWLFDCIGRPGQGEPERFHAVIAERLRLE